MKVTELGHGGFETELRSKKGHDGTIKSKNEAITSEQIIQSD